MMKGAMEPLSEAYKDHPPIDLQHIIPLDFQAIHQVPTSHLWLHQTNDHDDDDDDEHTSSSSLSSSSMIPVIDLLDPTAGDLIGQACEAWGMFQVVNHGISPSLLDEVVSEATRLFALPATVKNRALRSPEGATGYGVARISPFFTQLMWHEGFTIMGSPADHAKLLWPDDYQHFCDVMENYQDKMKTVAYNLFQLLLNYISPSSPPVATAVEFDGALQLNSYPPCPAPAQTIGLAPHTDTLFLTILHQSSPGLQLFDPAGLRWTAVDHVPGALTVNVGDLLHVLSNGKFRTARHRAVVMSDTTQRVSMACFYGPPVESTVSPVFTPGDGAPAVYRPVGVKEYLNLKALHLDDALDFIRL